MSRLSLCILAIIGTMTLTLARLLYAFDEFIQEVTFDPTHYFRTSVAAAPHHHHDEATAHFLKQLRKAKKHSQSSSVSFGGNREYEPAASGSSVDPTTTSILFPSQSSSSSGSSSGALGLPQIPPPSPASPQDIQRVNSGISTILQGVRSFDLGQILRGAFIFPRNENVKSVANTVLDNIFGPLGGNGGGSSSVDTADKSAPSFRN